MAAEDALASGLVHGRRIPGRGAAHTTLTSAQVEVAQNAVADPTAV
jgi:hypothetical protein